MKKIVDIQKISYQILLYFDQVCREHDITYFLSGGTLLGAIRHQGFIPWDDDIDVMLPRPEYQKLIGLARSCFHDKYVMHEVSIDDSWYEPWMRICDTTTEIYWPHLKKYPTGLFIDVFPIDAIPTEKWKSDIYFQRLKWKNICRNASLRKDYLSHENARIIKKILGKIATNVGVNRYCRDMNRIAQSGDYDNTVYAGVGIVCHYGNREKMPKDVFSKVIMVKFEDRQFPAPVGYDKYLSSLYGEYMKWPPQEKRVSDHRGVVTFFTDYEKEKNNETE